MSTEILNYSLNEEQEAILQTVRKITKDVVEPQATEIDKKGEYPWEIMKIFAREEQKKRYFPKLAAGELLSAIAMSEPDAGSDLAALKTKAVKDGDYYILNGEKRWITNASVADLYVVFARTSQEDKKAKGISAFIVEKDTPGFSLGRKEDKLGARGSVTGDLIFQDCKIHKNQLMGEEGKGFILAMQSLNKERPIAASLALGVAEGAIEYSTNYAKERVQFGKSISHFQSIQFMLADMKMQVEAA